MFMEDTTTSSEATTTSSEATTTSSEATTTSEMNTNLNWTEPVMDTTAETMDTSMVCNFETGDGTGANEKMVGQFSTAQECAAAVQLNEPEANGATWGGSGGGCYAEFGMAGVNPDAAAWQTCMFMT